MSTPTATPRPARTRISLLRVGIVLMCIALVGWTGTRAISAAITPPPTPGPSVFTGYVDVTATPTYPFETPSGPAQSNVILAFVVAGPDHQCAATWGGSYTLDQAASQLDLDRRMSQLRLVGGQARVSFGGQAGTELASACTDPVALREAYQSVVDRYKLTSIDLDIEGTSLADTAAATRRAAAVKDVQDQVKTAGRSLAIWLTLPVAPTGLTASGASVVAGMLSAGVNLAGVNGMVMDFGEASTPAQPLSKAVILASTALHAQVSRAFEQASQPLDDDQAWAKTGIVPMIGQNDVAAEQFTLADAVAVNHFARAHRVGQLSMWSLNRDSTCAPPLPTALPVVQTSCSGIDQGTQRFANLLAASLPTPSASAHPSPSDNGRSPIPSPTAETADDPAHSPFPIWDSLGRYPAGTKIVWHHQVFNARYWTTGFAPNTPVANAQDSPWTLLGPVLPGDTPAPMPTLPPGTYPQWSPTHTYTAGSRVQLGLVPYEAKWWSQKQEPGLFFASGSPWLLVLPGT
ncbi:MAG TPA: glycosyl hydrolase family 18 [Dermatophilaceae bacterium]|jgi:chitinase